MPKKPHPLKDNANSVVSAENSLIHQFKKNYNYKNYKKYKQL